MTTCGAPGNKPRRVYSGDLDVRLTWDCLSTYKLPHLKLPFVSLGLYVFLPHQSSAWMHSEVFSTFRLVYCLFNIWLSCGEWNCISFYAPVFQPQLCALVTLKTHTRLGNGRYYNVIRVRSNTTRLCWVQTRSGVVWQPHLELSALNTRFSDDVKFVWQIRLCFVKHSSSPYFIKCPGFNIQEHW